MGASSMASNGLLAGCETFGGGGRGGADEADDDVEPENFRENYKTLFLTNEFINTNHNDNTSTPSIDFFLRRKFEQVSNPGDTMLFYSHILKTHPKLTILLARGTHSLTMQSYLNTDLPMNVTATSKLEAFSHIRQHILDEYLYVLLILR